MTLTTDIVDLRKVGEFYLPDKARVHRVAADALASVSADTSAAFAACGTESGERSSAYGPWVELYSLVHAAIADTCVNLRDAGTGTVLAADDFAEQDTTNATSLDAVNAEMERFYNGDPQADPPVYAHERSAGVADPAALDVPDPDAPISDAPVSSAPLPTDGGSEAV